METHVERIINNRGIGIFLIVDHTANLRKNSKIFPIWCYSGDPINWWIKAKRVIATHSISMPWIIYLVPVWLRSASNLFAP